eukprot:648259_1
MATQWRKKDETIGKFAPIQMKIPSLPKAAPRRYNHIPEVSHVEYDPLLLDRLKRIEEAAQIIRQSKEPFWGELIKMLYLNGFEIDVIKEAFKVAHQAFKWRGQIGIWFQESRPTCNEQLEFADGNGVESWQVIKRLIEQNCQESTPSITKMK